MKIWATNWKMNFSIHKSHKGLNSRICEKCLWVNGGKDSIQIGEEAEKLIVISQRRETQILINMWKKISTSLIIEKWKFKT